MSEHYTITPTEVAALRALNERIVEVSPAEVAVSARLLPNQARDALTALERSGLATSWHPVAGRTGEHLFVPTDTGRIVYRALAQFKDIPPTGTMVPLPSPYPTVCGLLSRDESPSYVEIVIGD
jgi:hypothetical protein